MSGRAFDRGGAVALLADLALADKPDVVLHALELACGASALDVSQAELDAAIEERRAAEAREP